MSTPPTSTSPAASRPPAAHHPRRPVRWVVIGALVGLALGWFLSARGPALAEFPQYKNYSESTAALFLGAGFALLGALLGGLAFAVIDRWTRRDEAVGD